MNVCLRQHSLESMLTAATVPVTDVFQLPLSVSMSRWYVVMHCWASVGWFHLSATQSGQTPGKELPATINGSGTVRKKQFAFGNRD